jgi:hypothetical protein
VAWVDVIAATAELTVALGDVVATHLAVAGAERGDVVAIDVCIVAGMVARLAVAWGDIVAVAVAFAVDGVAGVAEPSVAWGDMAVGIVAGVVARLAVAWGDIVAVAVAVVGVAGVDNCLLLGATWLWA